MVGTTARARWSPAPVCIGRQRNVGVGGLFNFPGRAAKHDRIAAARGGRVGLYACILLPCQKLASGTVPVPVPVPRGDRDRRIKRPAKEISRRGTGTTFVEQQTCDPARPGARSASVAPNVLRDKYTLGLGFLTGPRQRAAAAAAIVADSVAWARARHETETTCRAAPRRRLGRHRLLAPSVAGQPRSAGTGRHGTSEPSCRAPRARDQRTAAGPSATARTARTQIFSPRLSEQQVPCAARLA